MDVLNLGKTPVEQIRFTLPEACLGCSVKAGGASVPAAKDGQPSRGGMRGYVVTLPAPVAPSESVQLSFDYTLAAGGLDRAWQIRRDYAIGWENWFPIPDGVRDLAAPCNMEIATGGALTPVACGLVAESTRDSTRFKCAARIVPFFVAGLFQSARSRIGPVTYDYYRVLDVNDALTTGIIAPAVHDVARSVGERLGAPAYHHLTLVIAKQDQIPWEDRPWFSWINARWFDNPFRTRASYLPFAVKITRAWGMDSWRPEGERAPVMSYALSAWLALLAVEGRYGEADARALAVRFQRTRDLKMFFGSENVDAPLFPKEPAQLLGPCPHAVLSELLGRERYLGVLKKLLEERRGQPVSVADLQALIAKETGEDLSAAIKQWIYDAAQADYTVAGGPKAVPWKGGVASQVTVENRGQGRMKVAVEFESLDGNVRTGVCWLDPRERRTLHLPTELPLDRVTLDPDKGIPQSSVENDEWNNPNLKEPPDILVLTDGRKIRGRVVEENEQFYKIDVGPGRTSILRSTVEKRETTPFGAYLLLLKKAAGGKYDHLALARQAAANGWPYEAGFHALARLVEDPGDAEAKAIAAKFAK